jgi:hypothetical protein
MSLSREALKICSVATRCSVELLSVMLQRNFGCESDTACGLPMKSLGYATGAIENCDRRFSVLDSKYKPESRKTPKRN